MSCINNGTSIDNIRVMPIPVERCNSVYGLLVGSTADGCPPE